MLGFPLPNPPRFCNPPLKSANVPMARFFALLSISCEHFTPANALPKPLPKICAASASAIRLRAMCDSLGNDNSANEANDSATAKSANDSATAKSANDSAIAQTANGSHVNSSHVNYLLHCTMLHCTMLHCTMLHCTRLPARA